MFDGRKGYAGNSPGQSISDVLTRLTLRDLQIVVGPRVLPLIPELSGGDRTPLIAAALRALQDRAVDILQDSNVRKTILRNLDPGKLEELKFRLGQEGINVASDTSDIPELAQPKPWRTACGFFGLQSEETAVGATPLHDQVLEPSFPLFTHQRSVVKRAYDRVGKGQGRTLIHMPTGSGKTRTAMHLVARALNEHEPCVVVWLATSRELLEQAAETFEKAWKSLGNREVEMLRFWGSGAPAPELIRDGLIIAGLSKLHSWRDRNSVAFFRLSTRVRLVVMDEAHQAVAPTYQTLIEGLCGGGSHDALVGLTATPGRSWNDLGQDEALSGFFGGSKVVLEIGNDPNPVKYLLEQGYLAKPKFGQIEYAPGITVSAGELAKLKGAPDFSAKILEKIASNAARNISIIYALRSLVARGHLRIVMFAVSVEHAQDIASAVVAYGINSAVVTGATPLPVRASLLKAFKSSDPEPQVLCNFGVLTTGFDAPKTSAAVIARPTKSLVLYSQMVGRATRGPRAGGNETCEILTVHDPAYPGFGDIAEAFFNWEDVWNEE